MKQRTVLHLIDTTGPGGAETVFLNIIRELPTNRFRSLPVVTGTGWLHDALVAQGTPPVVLPATGRTAYLKALTKMMREVRPAIVHSHLLGSITYGSIAARLSGIPALGTFHGPADLPDNDRFRNVRFRLIEWAASLLVFVSHSLRSYVVGSTTLDPRMCSVIHNGVGSDMFATAPPAPLRAELGISDETILLGCLGNIRAPKGYDYLLKALAALPESLPAWHAAIVGAIDDESAFAPICRLRSELGLESRVTFVGFRSDVANVLRSFDMFVLPSVTEGFSLATVQALASGLPVVATRSGGPEEILSDRRGGVLVPAADSHALAGAIARLVLDRELRAELSASAQGLVRSRFSMEEMISSYLAIYEGLAMVAVQSPNVAAAVRDEGGERASSQPRGSKPRDR